MATSFLKPLRAAVAVLGAVVMTMLFVAVPGAEASHGAGQTIDMQSNEECIKIGSAEGDWSQLKVGSSGEGGDGSAVDSDEYSDGTLTVDIDVSPNSSTGAVFSWSSNIGVDAVVVKGGPNGTLYDYRPNEATSGDGLHAPFNEESGKYYGLSNVTFCYDVEEQDQPADIGLVVDKVNDAGGDGSFSDDETASTEGADVPFRVTITNPDSSEASVDLTSATDTWEGGSADLFEECDNLSADTVLAPGDSVECIFTLTDYAPPAGESLADTVTVEGHEQGNADNTTSADDDSAVDTAAGSPPPTDIGLVVDKANDAGGDGLFTDDETASAEGADVPFRVVVSVLESAEAPVELSAATDAYDDSTVDLFEQCDDLSADTVLTPGDSVECTFTLTDYAPPAGESLDNTVTVEGHEQGNTDNTTSDSDDSTVDTEELTTPPAAIELEVDKTNDASGDDSFSDDETAPTEGADVPFRVEVTNPADSEASVDLTSATDTWDGGSADLFEQCDDLSADTVLAPGDSVECTFTLTGYAPPAGESLANTVTVEGHEQGNTDNTVSADDDSTVDTEEEAVLGEDDERDQTSEPAPQPGIAVDKVALVSPGAAGRMTVTYMPDDGDEETVTYSYTVTNTGDTTLEQVQLTDDVLGTITLEDTTLEPGQSTTATADHVVTEADADEGEIVNVATALGTAPDGEQVTAEDDELVLVAEVQSAVESANERIDRAPADDQLPATGADPIGASALAIGLLVIGGIALVATRQRATA